MQTFPAPATTSISKVPASADSLAHSHTSTSYARATKKGWRNPASTRPAGALSAVRYHNVLIIAKIQALC